MQNCVRLIGALKMKICRPGGHALGQRSAFSRHRRFCCLNFQAIAGPDGIILHLFGPLEGWRHGSAIYRRSEVDGNLGPAFMIDGERRCAHGDPASPHRPRLQLGCQLPALDEDQRLFDASMNSARICAERRYKDMKQRFSAINLPRKMKAREPSISLLRISAALLLSFKTRLSHEHQAARHFRCKPLSAREYLGSWGKEQIRKWN